MRVIAGSAKGHKLIAPKGNEKTRPTLERNKESFFNIIAPDIAGAAFLDLFCGSGAIGIEALSRGASSCSFVDFDPEALRCVEHNLAHTKLTEKGCIFALDVIDALTKMKDKQCVYDIVFMDPPYDSSHYTNCLSFLGQAPMLNPGGFIVAEHLTKKPLSDIPGLKPVKSRNYGLTTMTYFEMS